MHQMTENDGYHKHLSDTLNAGLLASGPRVRETSRALNTDGVLDMQHMRKHKNTFSFILLWTKQKITVAL